MKSASRSARGEAHTPELRSMYVRFGVSLAVSLVVMYLLAFSQIAAVRHFHLALSVLWISLSMIAAMGIIMLVSMSRMLKDPRKNRVLFAAFAILLIGAFSGSRTEALVGDGAFLRSMIPHHSRAIHMCNQASLSDAEIIDLCGQIVDSQTREIGQMERILARLG